MQHSFGSSCVSRMFILRTSWTTNHALHVSLTAAAIIVVAASVVLAAAPEDCNK